MFLRCIAESTGEDLALLEICIVCICDPAGSFKVLKAIWAPLPVFDWPIAARSECQAIWG